MTAIRYIIEVIICSGLFTVFYRWLLAGKISFRLCRAYIMTTMLLAVVIPALNVPLYENDTHTETLIETFIMGGNAEKTETVEALNTSEESIATSPAEASHERTEKNTAWIKIVGAAAAVCVVAAGAAGAAEPGCHRSGSA